MPDRLLLAKLSRTDADIHRAEFDNRDLLAAALDLWRAALHCRLALRWLRVRALNLAAGILSRRACHE